MLNSLFDDAKLMLNYEKTLFFDTENPQPSFEGPLDGVTLFSSL
jgi:hypothetical protein